MRVFVIILSLLWVNIQVKAQSSKDILGKWISPKKTAIVSITENNQSFEGKIIWIKDKFIKSTSTEKETIFDIIAIKGLVYNAETKRWEKGKAFVPKIDVYIDSEARMIDIDKVEIKGFVGVSWIGKTEIWTRYLEEDFPN